MSNQSCPRHQRPSSLPTFLFGAPYYPEQWTPQDRQDDPQRMAAAGMNVVRMGEFAWDLMEPSLGKFNFSLFDETIARLGAVGIKTIFCTPTAAPPRWLTIDHPDWMRVNEQGVHMDHGTRQHCCTNNEQFRAQSRRITEVMARHFAANQDVIGWQTDNEFYCHFTYCYCQSCVEGFQNWCKAKYGTIDKLNAAWGNSFWALTYDSFEQVPLPYLNSRPAFPNPSHELDYRRYISDSVCEFQRQQVQILKATRSDWFITHNSPCFNMDTWKLSRDLDIMGFDLYPGFVVKSVADSVRPAFELQHARAVGGGFLVLEQQAGPGGQKSYILPTPQPGQMRMWAYNSIANGADGVLHFRWRTCRFGAEEYWCGILDHDNIPRRRYLEFSQEGTELKRIGQDILGTTQDVQSAVLVDSQQTEAHASLNHSYPGPYQQGFQAFSEMSRRHLPCGVVNLEDSLAGLKLAIVPTFYMIDESLAAKLRAFVQEGGVLVASARTATKDYDNQCLSITPPGPLADVFGVAVEEFGKAEPAGLTIDLGGGKTLPSGALYEILSLKGAQSLGRWMAPQDGAVSAFADQPAVSVNRFGKGQAIYIGTFIAPENVKEIVDLVLRHAEIGQLAKGPDWVQVTRRRNDRHSLLFVVNHYPTRQRVSTSEGVDLITGKKCDGTLDLEPFGVAVIEEARA